MVDPKRQKHISKLLCSRLKIPTNNPKPALRMACKYAFDWKKENKERFDFAVILTRIRFGVSGYAPVYRMCVEYKSCTLVSDSGFNSAFIIAHEMAHSVGVLHDGDNNRCTTSGAAGSLMSPTIYSTFHKYHWSNCSTLTMRENLRYFNCLYDKPRYYEFNSLELPGEKFDLDEQCRYRMGKGHTACLGKRDPQLYCRYLFCRRPKQTRRGKVSCTYWSIAPPDGTICATGRWCVAGKCLKKGLLTPSPIDGGWSKWGKWGRCKGTCDKGVQFRKRKCNDPQVENGGKPCEGSWQEWRVCDMEPCTVNKVLQDQRLEQCYRKGKGWNWLPNTNILQDLKQVNLNCTFEDGVCGWEMGSGKFAYTFAKGETPTKDTGPEHDHTLQNKSGSYIFLEASYPRRRQDKVYISSPLLFIHKSCFKFHYHMYGSRVGTLAVYASYGNRFKRKQLWKTAGGHDNKWYDAQISLQEEREFQIVVESVVGNNYLSDIALDDFSITDGICNTSETQCWSVVSGGCVIRHNIAAYQQKSVEECKKMCLKEPKCVAFEFGVDHGGRATRYNPGFCQLQDSDNSLGCDGFKHNLDLYVKSDCVKDGHLNPCNITCVHAEKRTITYGHAVGDGNKCFPDREDMCVNGNCWNVGCDGKRGSKLRFDKCGKCNGDGSTCNKVDATFRAVPRKATEALLTLPAGTTNLQIRSEGSHGSFIAVRYGENTYYYDTAPPFYPWYYFKLAGSTFRYHFMANKSQAIYADGPTIKPSHILLYFQDSNYDNPNKDELFINVTYYVRKQPDEEMYLWQVGQQGDKCDVTCGGGYRSSEFECVDMRSARVVNETKCSPANVKPIGGKTPCNMRPCRKRFEYQAGPWGKCSTCNKPGRRTRKVKCIKLEEGRTNSTLTTQVVVDGLFCENIVKPVEKKRCYLYCPYARRKCVERQKKCPAMRRKGYCRYRSVQLLCCKTCAVNSTERTASFEMPL